MPNHVPIGQITASPRCWACLSVLVVRGNRQPLNLKKRETTNYVFNPSKTLSSLECSLWLLKLNGLLQYNRVALSPWKIRMPRLSLAENRQIDSDFGKPRPTEELSLDIPHLSVSGHNTSMKVRISIITRQSDVVDTHRHHRKRQG